MYSRRNKSFGKIYKFLSCESEQCNNDTGFSFATGPSLNLVERQPISSNLDENYYRWEQMLNREYIIMRVNRASTICGLVSTVIEQLFGHCYT